MVFSKKTLVLLISVGLLAGLVVIGLIIYNTLTIPIRVAPMNAKILLDGREITNESRQWLGQADHTVTISAEGFETLDEKLSEQGKPTIDYLFCLQPKTEAAKLEIRKSERNVRICEGVAGRYQTELSRKVYAKNPILNELPFNEGLFSIGQGLSIKNKDDPEKFGIYVHYYDDQSLVDAKKWLSDRNVDMNNQEIIYSKDYSDNRTTTGDNTAAYKELVANFPIVAKLPFKDPYYTISYRSLNSKDLRLVVYTSSPRYRYVALKQLPILGYNQTDYQIEFVDYKNPLGEK